MTDLLDATKTTKAEKNYTAASIEVLEGLEPVRRRPGMYIGGTDAAALHHLVIEVLDNAMDEAVAGHASKISLALNADSSITITDNGRGIPVDPHPRFPETSALEIIMTRLHAGGKFSDKAYATAGGLHGVGISVVNALSEKLEVEVARGKQLYTQTYSCGAPDAPLKNVGAVHNRRGTSVTFWPDMDIFDSGVRFSPQRLYRMVRAKAFLFRGVAIDVSFAPELMPADASFPAKTTLHFPNGLADFLALTLKDREAITANTFAGQADFEEGQGRIEWAIGWPEDEEGMAQSYCNTIATPQGGTHENGLRAALLKGLRQYGDLSGEKMAANLTADDILNGACVLLSVFIKNPQFQGQTKEKLATREAARLTETALKDRFDQWLVSDTESGNALLQHVIAKAEERRKRKSQKELKRKSARKRLKLPGKLADCTRSEAEGTELFIVEGDSAGGSAKQARERETQAILPLRGKILNVISNSAEKMLANKEIDALITALGGGFGANFKADDVRYERVIIMTDADVDGAHIAALLIAFFYDQMRTLITSGRLYLALPPLYRLSKGSKAFYARDDADKEQILETEFKNSDAVEISRFKGLGEMSPAQLKETTMAFETRGLMRITIEDAEDTKSLVMRLLGKKAEERFKFIQSNAAFVSDVDV